MNEQLAVLYPSLAAPTDTVPAARAARAAPPSSSDDFIARRLYGTPEHQPLTTNARAMTSAERLFGIDGGELSDIESYRDVGLREWYQTLELTPDQRADTTNALRQAAGDWGLGRQELGQLVGALHNAAREPVDAETEKRWGEDVERRLRAAHGDSWRNALDDARRLVASKPAIAEVLHESRVGSHPRVVTLLVEKARALRLRGAL